MSKYSAILLTVYGQAMITESASQKKPLIFTRIELGDGALEENESFVEFTKLKNSRLSMNINSITREANATCTIIAAVDNSEVEQGFFTREIGIFAKVGNDGDESLFAYTNAGNYADYTPDKTSTLDEKQIAINLAVGNATSVTAVIGSAQYATLKNLQDHNKDETAHENLIRVKSMSTTDDGINYVTQDNQSHSLGLWSTLKAVLTGTTAGNGNKNTLFQQLDAIAGMVKKITGGANWYDNPAASIQQLVSMVNNVSAISEYDVDDPNAWWVKLRGDPGLIIQGINDTSGWAGGNAKKKEMSFPITFPNANLITVLSETSGKIQATSGLIEGSNLMGTTTESTTIICQWTGGDISSPLSILAVGY